MRRMLMLLFAILLAMPASLGAQDQALYLKGYIYTLNGERQQVAKFLNVGFTDYHFIHDGIYRVVNPHDIKSVENRGMDNLVITIRGHRPSRGRVMDVFPGAAIQAMTGDINGKVTFEFYDKIQGQLKRGEVPCEEVKLLVFE
ncbi:hypothetical protein [Megalodesulfovibrio paquesii]